LAVALAFVIPAVPAAAPHLGGSRLDPVVVLWGCAPGSTGPCTFTAETRNASLIFFQYDLNVDGAWDFPQQTGCPVLGCWTTLTSVTWTVSEPFPGACVRAWDGVSTWIVGGIVRPLTAMGCTTFADFMPRSWDRNSPGRMVVVKLTIPAFLNPRDFDPTRAEVEGLPAILVGHAGQTMFIHVDRAALTRLLGPGPNTVHVTLPWLARSFTAAGSVTIF